ncbi:tyrosine-protein phosphatase [Streptomyces aureocirculatus]|uniref:tyrosine-protein phosphatase n=1 Tax=Streptomyces aureocirculatus TaxID=67275 RepID=UPI000D140B3E|nr:tyrosine-protein phosphatase [Streptomyces aureocirculatus]
MKTHISFERLHNFRDVGGHVTEDGRTVRWGQVYRSGALSRLRDADWDRFLALGVRTVIDLRHGREIDAQGRVPEHPSFAYHHLGVERRPDEDGVRELRRALELIAAEESGPVVFHCTTGENRTELLAALVLALIGVAEADIARAEIAEDFAIAGTAERYGSLRAYATHVLGADDALVAALRRRLLEPVAGAELTFRRGVEADIPVLVRLRDEAARWQIAHGIAQWKPGELGVEHFRARLADSELWIATLGPDGPVAGAWELWWDDPAAWGPQPPVAGYVHRLMTDRATAPAGTGRRMLAHAERRVRAAGRGLCRLDCRANNPRLRAYYASAGYEVVGEQPSKDGGVGGRFAATLLQKPVRDDAEAPRCGVGERRLRARL